MKFKVFRFNKVKSTNNTAIKIIKTSDFDYGMIVSENQSNGKGQYGKKWISYGEHNDYFDTLVQRYMGSPTNSRCINGIVDMISGRGIECTDSDRFPEQHAKMKLLLRNRELKNLF